MSLLGQGVLAIWNGITPEAEEDFYRWHNTEHIPERVAVPGFLRGRRYASTARPRDYFTLYETESVETIRSEPYLARLNDPTPWTRRVLPHFRDTVRVGCRVAVSAGRSQGGAILTVRLIPLGDQEAALRAWLAGPGLALARVLAGVVGVHVLEPAAETTRIETAEKKLRGHQPNERDAVAPWIILVETTDPEVADQVGRGLLAPSELSTQGAQPGAVLATYRLQVSLDRD